MPKLEYALPRYRKHKASGQAVVSLGGVEHSLGPHGSDRSRTEYDRLINECLLLAGRRAEVVNRAGGISVVQLLLAFLMVTASFESLSAAPSFSPEPTHEIPDSGITRVG